MRNYSVTLNGKRFEANLISREHSRVVFEVNGKTFDIDIESKLQRSELSPAAAPIQTPIAPLKQSSAPGSIIAPMPGIIVNVQVKVGEQVKVGQTVLVMEAMKMENNVAASSAGTVKEIHVKSGDEVMNGQPLITIKNS